MRRHLLVCRSEVGPGFINAAYDGKAWVADADAPRRLETMLLTLPNLLRQIDRADFTLSPFRRLGEICENWIQFGDLALPDGKPVALACPLAPGGHERSYWQWLQWYSCDAPPLPSGRRFAESELVNEVSELLKLDNPAATWAADREVWVRHDLSQAELLAVAA